MFRFAFKNLLIKKLNVILIIVSIMLSAGTALLAYNTATQVSEGIDNTASYFPIIIGPSGSATQLVMNTMYFTDKPIDTFPYEEVYQKLTGQDCASYIQNVTDENGKETTQKYIVPFAMADSYGEYKCVGTTSLFFDGRTCSEGSLFDDNSEMEAVVGYNVAKANDLVIGEKIVTGHSGVQHTSGLTVVGILDKTNTAYDNVVFTQLQTIWTLHEEGEEEDHDEEDAGEAHAHAGEVCAILVKTATTSANGKLIEIMEKFSVTVVEEHDHDHGEAEETSGHTETAGQSETAGHTTPGEEDEDDDTTDTKIIKFQAVIPSEVITEIKKEVDSTKYIVYILCGIILAMNILVISIITLLNMNYSAKEIRLMRLIGVSMKKISLLYMIENGIIGLFSTLFAFLTSRVCALLMNDYVENMGLVLNQFKVYPLEFVIMAGVLIITMLPTLICTKVIGKQDAI